MDTKTIIIAGGRHINDYDALKEAIESSPWFGRIDTVYTGDAKGVDRMAVRWAKENGITYRIFKAEWNFYGRGAGPERNKDMVLSGGEGVILLWDGESRGSKSMKEIAEKHNLFVHERIWNEDERRKDSRTQTLP